MPQGDLLHCPSHCLALHPAQVAWIKRCLRHLLPKKAPWLQGARPQDETHCVRRLRDKKGAVKKSLGLKKTQACSPL